ncbi:hypothetical protein LPB140_00115 [Sphingorhabdus lutea]|uniref:DUF218 domain-containing protein n=1 Tax=Sphingorhabdus lutea TaxID=1913578 RepID=A0A1L3JE57_9SPHN|nr:YdcF family protein [Sphingorhabdus lutea]APG63412.1 hypothetical protein LPB140_00115 [Sphingorhabdus lutea]
MIRRVLAFILLVWILGFAWFGFALPQRADNKVRTDAIVVLTGGTGRIEPALKLLENGAAKRLLISGVDRDVKPGELAAEYDREMAIFDCCIDLGFESVDTRSNALETARWASVHGVKSIRLVTNDWHMRRARLELDLSMPNGVKITNDALPTHPSLFQLFKEYNKYALRLIASLIGI